jgi:threonine aldolase
MLVGSKKQSTGARSSQALGGGMTGILAAQDVIALHEMPKRLHEDHTRSRAGGRRAGRSRGGGDRPKLCRQTSIFRLRGKAENSGGDAAAFTAALKQKGVLVSAIGPHQVRFVTHYDVDRAACEKAAAIVSDQLRALTA